MQLFKINKEKEKWLKKLTYWKLTIKNSKKSLKVPIRAVHRTKLKVHWSLHSKPRFKNLANKPAELQTKEHSISKTLIAKFWNTISRKRLLLWATSKKPKTKKRTILVTNCIQAEKAPPKRSLQHIKERITVLQLRDKDPSSRFTRRSTRWSTPGPGGPLPCERSFRA